MLGVSISLVLAMMVARSSVDAKIAQIKATTGTTITITPAGFQSGLGGGDALTNSQAKQVSQTPHIISVASTLTDELGSTDTSLTPSLQLGGLGKRQLRFMRPDGSTSTQVEEPKPHITVTGTTAPSASVPDSKITSGAMIDGDSSNLVALVGKDLAAKNNLTAGSTFTAYGQTIIVKGIYSSGNTFQDSNVIMPLVPVQTLTDQPGAISSITAKIDSSDNVASAVSALKTTLSSKADITSEQEQIANSLQPLKNIASLALTGVIGASIAGAIIMLLAMVMIVRERKREIGVIKAIGGSNIKVISQFIAEALTLTIIGGIIGVVLGIAISGPMTQSLVSNSSESPEPRAGRSLHISGGPRAVFGDASVQIQNNLKNITATITPQIFAFSVGIMVFIAIIGSTLPAWVIAKVRPGEVLRTD